MPVFMFDKSFGNTGLYIVDIPDRLTQIPEHITLVKGTEPVGLGEKVIIKICIHISEIIPWN